MYGDIGRAFNAFVIVCVIASIAVGAIGAFFIPWLWSLIKPWLHMVTA